MKKKFNELPLRNGVGVVLLNKNNKVFVAKRIDNPKNYWHYLNAALRELEEETSIKSVKLIKEIDGYLTYNLPDELLGIIWKGKYKGQKQKWYIMKFTGDESEINVKTKKPEFLDWRWINIENITDTVVEFKSDVYNKIKNEVKKIIAN